MPKQDTEGGRSCLPLQRSEGQDGNLFHAKQEVVSRMASSHGGRHFSQKALRTYSEEETLVLFHFLSLV